MKGVKMRLRPCIVKDPGGIPGDNMIQYQIFIYTCKSFQLQPVCQHPSSPFICPHKPWEEGVLV